MAEPSKSEPKPTKSQNRDFLVHLESYIARRDGVDKLLKIARYTAKLLLSSPSIPETLTPNLKSFETSVGLSRKAFRLGKFVQDLNSLRFSDPNSLSSLIIHVIAYGGEGIYYFIEQLAWLSKSGLIPPLSKKLTKISAWCDLIGYFGRIWLKVRDVKELRLKLEEEKEEDEKEKLNEKLVTKKLSIVQDFADGLMAVAEVREGKGVMTGPGLMATAGLVSALISTHKNWHSC